MSAPVDSFVAAEHPQQPFQTFDQGFEGATPTRESPQ
jgi:hypothetical protein